MEMLKEWFLKYKPAVTYCLLMLGCGVFQLIDWHFGSEDPIWHIMFYIIFMPVFSLVFGLSLGRSKGWWCCPFLAAFLAFFVYLFMANGGPSFGKDDLDGALTLCIPSFLTASIGVMIRRLRFLFLRLRSGSKEQ